ncbi:hypothetical protein [Streptomyces achromogenes]|uniref:hypothetical protein n=1 Tax=Streptomyces achromogenes TaxID=67255 RepID=UPI00341B1833
MASRSRAKSVASSGSGDTREQDTAAADTMTAVEVSACGAVHPLPLLAHVVCQRPAGHADTEVPASDQDKHRARIAGALYLW